MPRGFLVTATALATIVIAYVFAFRPDATIDRRDQDDSPRSLPSPNEGEAAPADTTARRTQEHPLQTYLLSMTDPPRDSLLLSMIRDADLPCEGLLSAQQMVEDTASWRISCMDAHAYLLEVDGFGSIRIEPLAYREGNPTRLPTETIPERDGEQ